MPLGEAVRNRGALAFAASLKPSCRTCVFAQPGFSGREVPLDGSDPPLWLRAWYAHAHASGKYVCFPCSCRLASCAYSKLLPNT